MADVACWQLTAAVMRNILMAQRDVAWHERTTAAVNFCQLLSHSRQCIWQKLESVPVGVFIHGVQSEGLGLWLNNNLN